MPRRPSSGEKGFIWVPRPKTAFTKVEVNGVDVTLRQFPSTYIKNLCPSVPHCEINLINTDGLYNDQFSQGDEIKVYLDFVDATDLEWYGVIDSINNVYEEESGFILKITGSLPLNDLTVTKSTDGTTQNDVVLKELFAEYLPTYTTTNVSSTPTKTDFNWKNKPFWECVYDICLASRTADDSSTAFDAYVDEDKDCHFFQRGSITSTTEAAVVNDTFLSSEGLGEQTIQTKNKIIVYAQDSGGLPIIATSENSSSQSSYGTKEEVIFNNDIESQTQASEISSNQLNDQSTLNTEGNVVARILPSLEAGEKLYIINSSLNIHDAYRTFEIKHELPDQITTCKINKDLSFNKVISKRVSSERGLRNIDNPHKMGNSINFPFDSASELATKEANVAIANGKVYLTSGTQGTFTTTLKTVAEDITSVDPRIAGSLVATVTIQVSVDSGNNYETVTPNTLNELTVTGKDVIFKIIINDASTEIESLALLYKF